MRIEHHKSLRSSNTFGIQVYAKLFAEVHGVEELAALRGEEAYRRERRLVLGGGSNILFRSDFDGLVIKNSISGLERLREDAVHVWIRAGAGVVWDDVVQYCVTNGLAGVENLSLIPGLVGAAPMQNIGAYGVELESVCEHVEAVHLESGEPASFDRAACAFGYRDSVFKRRLAGEFLITAVTLRLDKTPQFQIGYGDVRATLEAMGVRDLTIAAIRQAVIQIRTAKLPDPKQIGNAGSFFKNPIVAATRFEELRSRFPDMPHYPQADGGVKIPAGWLIEQCGWKGQRRGQAGVHSRQALVLVNLGGASGEDLVRLSREVHQSVLERFGIDLVPEVNVVG